MISSLTILSLPVYSLNYSFLNDSAIEKMTKEDWAISKEAHIKALRLPNGEKVLWRNPQSNHHGYVEALDYEKINGMECRKVRTYNQTNYYNSMYVFTYCKYKNDWKIED
jgi:surface antigen